MGLLLLHFFPWFCFPIRIRIECMLETGKGNKETCLGRVLEDVHLSN